MIISMRLPAILALTCGVAALAATTDPFAGRWELNVVRCKYEGAKVPQRLTVVYESNGAGIRYRSSGLDANGKQLSSAYSAKFDGKPYPVAGSRTWAPVTLKRADARTIEARYVRDGKVQSTAVSVVSGDGKTLTVTTVTLSGAGKGITNVSVFERK
jgi:hypothetical protein